jgi:hypothetical protein
MCDLDSVSGLITAAEAAAVVVLAALAIAVVLRGSLYTAFASTVPMVAALIAIAIAISSLSTAAALLNNCLGGSCNTEVRALQTAIGGLISAFTVIGVAIGIGMVFPIPWVGAVACAAIIVAMLAASLAFGFIGADLAALAACERMSSTVISTAGRGGFVVAGILSVGLVALTGYGVFRPQMSGEPPP